MSNHNHSCSCDHAQVRYCKSCRIVHCADCNQEWSPRSYYNYPYYGYGYLGNTMLSGATGVTLTSTGTGVDLQKGDNTLQANYQTVEPTCNHGKE